MNLSLPFAQWSAPPVPAGADVGQPALEAGAATGHADAALRLGIDAEALHPALWRASQLGGARGAVSTSGWATLDAQLPGGGWPHGALTELLLPRPGIGELRLLAPVLAAPADPQPAIPPGARPAIPLGVRPAIPPGAAGPPGAGSIADAGDGRSVILFDPPASPSAWALLQHGLAPQRWLVVRGRAPRPPRAPGDIAPLLPNPDLLWALEHTLRSGHAGVVLAWLPLALRADVLRRLQLAAQACDGPVFVFRDTRARSRPSPAPLRLSLQPAGIDGLAVRVLKRRGPPLAEPLRLALPPVLTPRQQAQALLRQAARRSDRSAILRDG